MISRDHALGLYLQKHTCNNKPINSLGMSAAAARLVHHNGLCSLLQCGMLQKYQYAALNIMLQCMEAVLEQQ